MAKLASAIKSQKPFMSLDPIFIALGSVDKLQTPTILFRKITRFSKQVMS